MSYPKVEKVCLTCQHYDVGKCKLHGYLSYQACFEHRCKDYKLSDDYKKGGKFYEEKT